MNKSMGGLYTITEWITRFAYVNLLWIGFSLLGLGLFGISPATVAMFSVIRKWIMGDTDIPVFRTFWTAYKQDFLKSNGIGLVIALIAFIIYVDLKFIKINPSMQIPLYLFSLTVVMTILYLFPVFVHYNVKFLQLFKNSFFIMLVNPLANLLMLAGFVAAIFVISYLPALALFFGASIPAGIIMATSNLAFKKIEKSKKEAQAI